MNSKKQAILPEKESIKPHVTPLSRRLLVTFVGLQILSAICLTSIGIHAMVLCYNNQIIFAGITPILGALFIFQGSILACLVFSTKHIGSVIVALFNLLTSCSVIVNEVLTFKCLTQLSSFCSSFERNFNMCVWLGFSDPDEQTTVLPREESRTFRTYLLILASIGVLCTIALLVLTSLENQMDDFVSLPLRRHKRSITVGDTRNAKLANMNKFTNLKMINATEREDEEYNDKKLRSALSSEKSVASSKRTDSGIVPVESMRNLSSAKLPSEQQRPEKSRVINAGIKTTYANDKLSYMDIHRPVYQSQR